MKRYFSKIFALAAGLLLLAACSGDDTEGIPSKELLDTNGTTLAVDGSSSTATLDIKANCRWTATLSSGWEGMALETRAGEGNGTIRILTGVNPMTKPRTGKIIVESGSGVIRREITVTQGAGDLILELSQDSFEAEAEGDAVVVTVHSNANWTVSGGATGYSCDVNEGNMDGSVKISIDENMKEDPRPAATFTFVARDETGEKTKSASITVTQKGKVVKLTASPLSITAQASGGTYQIAILCNAEWTAVAGESWLKLSEGHGEGNGAVSFECELNAPTEKRISSIHIAAGSKRAEIIIEQQPGALPTVGNITVNSTNKYSANLTLDFGSYTSPLVSYGVCYSKNPMPTLENDSKVEFNSMENGGNVSTTISNLVSGEKYYVRGFAINATGMTYGEETSFITQGAVPGEDDNGQPSMTKRR